MVVKYWNVYQKDIKRKYQKINLECKIEMRDIQSEERRELVFEFSLPKLDAENKEGPITQLLWQKKQEVLMVKKSRACTMSLRWKIFSGLRFERKQKIK